MGRIALGLVALAAAALALGYFAGPLLVGLIFGDAYVLGGRDVAVLAVGVAANIGLVLVTQVLVAAVRHRLVAWAWLSGVSVAAVILFTVPDLLLGAELAFLAGSLTGWLVATLLVLTTGRERELQRA
jgi:O-antigen/teichoic acid export membrane protein